MQASERARELERKFRSRRGHAAQISISDENHHVTEAIGDMYGDSSGSFKPRENRPLSFVPSPHGDSLPTSPTFRDGSTSPASPSNLKQFSRAMTSGPTSPASPPAANGFTKPSLSNSLQPENGATTPPQLNRHPSDTASQHFPVNDIDYESSPAAVAKELSNLQAIRRMSMDVVASDPDLPSFGHSFGMPAMAPTADKDEDDASRLFWVPARLHPELAPKEFKTFIDERVDKIKRRSGDAESLLSPMGGGSLEHSSSSSGLRRKKSMLSRQIDSSTGYKDGAERLERQRSINSQRDSVASIGSLHELEQIVSDPSAIRRRLSIDQATRRSLEGAEDGPIGEDMPILPPKPAGQTLKRSTRTNYRRGSLRKGERVPFSRRAAARHSDVETEDSPLGSPIKEMSGGEEPASLGISRVRTEPALSRPDSGVENFSRPSRKGRTPPPQSEGLAKPGSIPPSISPPLPSQSNQTSQSDSEQRATTASRGFQSRIASNGRTTARLPGESPPVPSIIETPPPGEPVRPAILQRPERTSSMDHSASVALQQQQTPPPRTTPSPPHHQQQHAVRPPSRPSQPLPSSSSSSSKPISQTFDELLSRPSPLPGSSTGRTDNLSIIPTLIEDTKKDKKSRKKEETSTDSGGSSSSGRKTGWGWLLGGDDSKKEKDKDDEKGTKRSKSKGKGSADKSAHDNTRLDLLQTSIDGGRGRESLVLDRESVRLDEERKKDSARRSGASDGKKEKDSGFLHGLFGGKKKTDREVSGKKAASLRGLSPEPPPRILRPDVDYNWTRFSIMEERAIYRMAHFKLANPRRELYSQVLLSNFMYSYLAKVQQMHPHMNLPQSAAHKQQQQRQAQEQQQQQRAEQPEEYAQYQRYQEQQARADSPSGSASSTNGQLSSHQHPTANYDGEGYGDGNGSNSADHLDHDHTNHNRIADPSASSNSNGGYSISSGANYMGQPAGSSQQQQQQQQQSYMQHAQQQSRKLHASPSSSSSSSSHHHHHHHHQQQPQQQHQRPYYASQEDLFEDEDPPGDDDMW